MLRNKSYVKEQAGINSPCVVFGPFLDAILKLSLFVDTS